METKHQRSEDNPFDIREGRAMVSLGPLSLKKYCTYSCPFCYVRSEFLSYRNWLPKEISTYLKDRREEYDIIYISGDTDSFAPPRTETGVALIEELLSLEKDILFTTRAILHQSHLERLANVAQVLAGKRKLLIGCVSIAQLSFPHLEPAPIRPASERITQLLRFKDFGLKSILAMRPFLPIVPISEYLEIVKKCSAAVHAILGEVWYSDTIGLLDKGVFRNANPEYEYILKEMDFDINESIWKVYHPKEKESAVAELCQNLNIPFFMRSRPAIEFLRNELSES